MTQRILVVSDQPGGHWLSRAGSGNAEWHLLPVGFGFEQFLALHGAALGGMNIVAAASAESAARAERDLQDFYPRFVADFPRQTKLLDLLKRRGDVNLWWLGETCEKGPLRGPLPSQLYSLALLEHMFAGRHFDEVWLDLTDDDLLHTIKTNLESRGLVIVPMPARRGAGRRAWLQRGGRQWALRQFVWRALSVLQAGGIKLVLLLAGVRRARRGSRFFAFFTRYPALWTTPHSAAQQERYFRHMEGELGRDVEPAYLAVISDWPWRFVRRVRGMRGRLVASHIHPLPLYTTWTDLFRVLVGHGLLRRLLRYMATGRVHRAEFLGWDISRLWHAEVLRTLSGPDIPANVLLQSSVRRFVESHDVEAVLNPLEYQPMERALWAGVNGRARSVALQHSTYAPNHFMYYFKPGELDGYVHGTVSEPSPMADYFLAAGPRPQETMLDNGIPADRVGLCGAVRYEDLRFETADVSAQRALRESLRLPPDRPVILVATSIHRAEAIALVGAFTRAVRFFSTGVTVAFKCHYHASIHAEIEDLCRSRAPHLDLSILPLDAPLHPHMRAADVVVAGGSTVAVEAVALGKPVLAYHDPALLNLNPLVAFPGSCRFVSTPEEIAAALNELLEGGGDAGLMRSKGVEAVEALFYRLDGRATERALNLLRGSS
jgi:hypothetical protein